MNKAIVVMEGSYASLKRARAVMLFLIGFLIVIGSYTGLRAYSHSRVQEGTIQSKQKQIIELKEEIEELQEVKKEYALRLKKASDFIKTNNPSLPQETAIQYAKWEIKYAAKYHVPLSVGLAVSKKESVWNKDAVSPTGPLGIKQVAFSFWGKRLGVTRQDLYNPKRNIEAGYQILAIYKKRTKDWQTALALYYGSMDDTENKQYANKVMLVASNY